MNATISTSLVVSFWMIAGIKSWRSNFSMLCVLILLWICLLSLALRVFAAITIRYLVRNINPTLAFRGESFEPIFDQSLTIRQMVQYKEQEESVSSCEEESSFLEKSSGNFLKEVSPKTH